MERKTETKAKKQRQRRETKRDKESGFSATKFELCDIHITAPIIKNVINISLF